MRSRTDRSSSRENLRVRPVVDAVEARLLLSTGLGHPKTARIVAKPADIPPYSLEEGALVQVSGASPLILSGIPGPPKNFPDTAVEPRIAVDPTNPDHLVGVWQQDRFADDGAQATVSAVSFDGGMTWKESIVPGLTFRSLGPYERASDPYVTFGVDGRVYTSSVVFNENHVGGQSATYVNISTNGGKTWHAPVSLQTLPSVASQTDKDSITGDPTTPGQAYDTWEDLDIPSTLLGFKGPAEFSKTTDGGLTWSPAKTIFDPGSNAITINNKILALPSGSLVDAFTQVSLTSGGFADTLETLTSQDKGQTFPAAPVQGPTLEGIPVTDPDNGSPIRTSSSPSGLPAQFADVTVDPTNGDLYAVWQDARFTLSQYDDIVFSASTDGGLTWSTPIPINQTPVNIPFADRQAFDPTIAVAADGSIGVSYYDFRNNTTDLGAKADAFLVVAPAGSNPTEPASWANEIRLTNNSFDIEDAPLTTGFTTGGGYFLGDYEGLTTSGDSFVAFFSATNGTDNTDVFARVVTQEP